MLKHSEIESLLNSVKEKLNYGGYNSVFENGYELKSNDLLERQDPEEFTRSFIIDKVLFDILGIELTGRNRKFDTPKGERKVDYSLKIETQNFLLEAKPINQDLYKKSDDGGINQIKGVFLLADVKENFVFGIATDGLKWVFINRNKEIIDELELLEDFEKIQSYLTFKRILPKKKRDEVSKIFYKEYTDILYGTNKIPIDNSFINSIHNVSKFEDREEIAQLIINRLLFLKFLNEMGHLNIIEKDWDLFDFIKKLPTHEVNAKIKQLFFNILNKPNDERGGSYDIDPNFLEIPFLNGSLFEKADVEEKNPDYYVDSKILKYTIGFLDKFRFTPFEKLKPEEELLDPEILGYIFEKTMTATSRKGTGAYYTPKQVTRYMARNVIFPLIVKKTKNYLVKFDNYNDSQVSHINRIEDVTNLPPVVLDKILHNVIYNIKICDPAMGSGAFLLAVAQVLFELVMKINIKLGHKYVDLGPEIKKRIIYNLYGVDINPRGVEIAQLRIWLWLVESYFSDCLKPLPNLDCNICTGNSLIGYKDISKFLENHIQVDLLEEKEEDIKDLIRQYEELKSEYKTSEGAKAKQLKKDFKKIKTPIQQRIDKYLYQFLKMEKIKIEPEQFKNLHSFHWGLEFDEIFDINKTIDEQGFDIIIGNPPYIKARDTKDVLTRNILNKDSGYKSLYKMWDIYIPFVERGLKLLKKDGIFTMIIPDTIGVAEYSNKLVDIILNNYSIYQVDFFPGINVFVGVGVHNKILFIRNNHKRSFCKKIIHENSVQNFRQFDVCSNNTLDLFKLDVSKINLDLKEVTPLSNICYVSYGLRLNSDKSDSNSFKKSDLLSEKKDRTHSKLYTEGKYLEKYRINKELYVEWGTERCPDRLVRRTFNELYPPTKLLLSREKRIATLSDDGIICDNTIIVGVPYHELKGVNNKSISKYFKNLKLNRDIVEETSVNYDLKYLLAIINSKLISYFLRDIARSELDSYPDDWKKIPIKIISLEKQKKFVDIVSDLLKIKKQADFKNNEERHEKACILEDKIDKLVYELYGLKDEEINTIETSLKEL